MTSTEAYLKEVLTNPDSARLGIERADCEESLSEFLQAAWKVVEPSQTYIHNWHIETICEHLEAVTFGKVTRLAIAVPPGTMKALDESVPILTLDGWKRHADVAPGDYVYGPDGKPKLVQAQTNEVFEESYQITFDDGAKIIAGSGHEWVVERDFNDKTTNWKRKRLKVTVPTTELKFGKRPDRIPVAAPIYQPKRELPIEPYLLGVWLGDGATNTGSIYSAEEDVWHFKSLGKIKYTTPAGGSRNQDFHRILVPGLSKQLSAAGLTGNKHVPSNYLLSDYDSRLALLQGLMDTDGTVEANGGAIFTNKNEKLADAVVEIVAAMGAKVRKKSRYTVLNGKRYGPHYMVRFIPPKGVRVFRLDRKQDKVRQSSKPRTFSRYVSSVEPLGLRKVKCIQVEGGLYLAGEHLVPTHNSLITSVFWPAWEWGPANRPGTRVVATSASERLAVRDNMRCRRLVQSEWYQGHWGHRVKLTGDQNAKTKFENLKTGFREACPFTSLTGTRGDRVIIDDPLSVDDAFSEATRESVATTFLESVPSRVNNPSTSAIVVIQQRLHERDVIGIIKDTPELGYTLLELPMEFEVDTRCSTSIGWEDPRTSEGQLLFPERFPADVLSTLKASLGEYGWASQMQQRPAPREGGILPKAHWRKWEKAQLPEIEYLIQSYDTAFSEKATSSYSARTTWGVFRYGSSMRIILLEYWRDRVAYPELRKLSKASYKEYEPDAVLIEKKASGQSLIQDLRMANIPVIEYNPDRDKIARAHAVSAMLEGGMIWYPDRRWAEEVVDLCAMFPAGNGSDVVDTCTQAWLRLRNSWFATLPEDIEEDEDEKVYKLRTPIYG